MSISFCTTLIDRWDNFAKMYQSLMPCLDRGCELIVTDWGSKDLDFSVFRRDHQVTFRFKSLPYRRTHGLNFSAEVAKFHTLFFIDADMVVPESFDTWINQRVKPGWAVFPICYSLNQGKPMEVKGDKMNSKDTNGWWRYQGFGMCGFHDRDFYDIQGWDPKYVQWGKADEDIWKKTNNSGIQVCRENCPGLYHLWHPGPFDKKNKYFVTEEPK